MFYQVYTRGYTWGTVKHWKYLYFRVPNTQCLVFYDPLRLLEENGMKPLAIARFADVCEDQGEYQGNLWTQTIREWICPSSSSGNDHNNKNSTSLHLYIDVKDEGELCVYQIQYSPLLSVISPSLSCVQTSIFLWTTLKCFWSVMETKERFRYEILRKDHW